MEYKIIVSPVTSRRSYNVKFYSTVYVLSGGVWHVIQWDSGLHDTHKRAEEIAKFHIGIYESDGWNIPKESDLIDYSTGEPNDT